MALSIESSAFTANSTIPTEYTCKGIDQSPPLRWYNAPNGTKSFVLIMDDPDAPSGTWVHWVLYNIPADVQQLAEASELPLGAASAQNSWGVTGYRGPCPPSGTHRYFFKLYALDTQLKLDQSADKQAVVNAMQNHILASSELIGLSTH